MKTTFSGTGDFSVLRQPESWRGGTQTNWFSSSRLGMTGRGEEAGSEGWYLS